MRLILSTPILLLLFIIPAAGQSTVPLVIIEVKASGFKIEPTADHTYLRVYDNGDVIFDDYKRSINGFSLNEFKLSPKEMIAFRIQLERASVLGWDESYSFSKPLTRIATKVEITIPRPNGFQIVKIGRNNSPKAESDIENLNRLVCAIENLRKNAVFRLIDMKACQK
jgi:hypothetical protein